MPPRSCTLWQHPGATVWLGNVSSIQPSTKSSCLSLSISPSLPSPFSLAPISHAHVHVGTRLGTGCSAPRRCRAAGLEPPCAYGWTKLPLWSSGTLSPPPCCQLLRRDGGHAPQIYTPAPKKGTETKTEAHACSLLRPFHSHTLGGTRSIPPHGEPGIPCSTRECSVLPRIPLLCTGSSVCTHTHTHTETCTDPGTRDNTWTRGAEPSPAGKLGQAGLWLTCTGAGLGNILDLSKTHQDSLGAARQTGSPAGLVKPR